LAIMSHPEQLAAAAEPPASSMGIDQVAQALGMASADDERRLIYAKGENTRHIRHAQILERWPILPEAWARSVERTRMAAVDRTPGAATFGR
jgi:hypothetical protein